MDCLNVKIFFNFHYLPKFEYHKIKILTISRTIYEMVGTNPLQGLNYRTLILIIHLTTRGVLVLFIGTYIQLPDASKL